MIEKFNGIIYLVIYIIHFGMLAVYAAQLLVGTRQFMDKFGIDHTAAFMVRFLGAFFLAWILMALYILFVRPNGVCLLYTSPSPRDVEESRMPSSA